MILGPVNWFESGSVVVRLQGKGHMIKPSTLTKLNFLSGSLALFQDYSLGNYCGQEGVAKLAFR